MASFGVCPCSYVGNLRHHRRYCLGVPGLPSAEPCGAVAQGVAQGLKSVAEKQSNSVAQSKLFQATARRALGGKLLGMQLNAYCSIAQLTEASELAVTATTLAIDHVHALLLRIAPKVQNFMIK